MARFDYITIGIVRTSTPAGHSCMVEYSYYLHTERDEYKSNEYYDIGCFLYGDDILRHKTLGEPPYDMHRIGSHDTMPVKRSFMVPCETLNEAWGKDNIYIKLIARSEHGATATRDSDVVSDWF